MRWLVWWWGISVFIFSLKERGGKIKERGGERGQLTWVAFEGVAWVR